MSDASPFSAFHRAIMREQRALGRRPGALPPSDPTALPGRDLIDAIKREISAIMADDSQRSVYTIEKRMGYGLRDVRIALAEMVADGLLHERVGSKVMATSYRRVKG